MQYSIHLQCTSKNTGSQGRSVLIFVPFFQDNMSPPRGDAALSPLGTVIRYTERVLPDGVCTPVSDLISTMMFCFKFDALGK